jgi:DNA-binding transcriptional LysR family regulator
MTNDSIAIFLYVAETNSLSAAAEQIHTTKQMVSQSIQALEQELGLQLVIRDKRSVLLTQAGEYFRDYFLQSIELFDRADHEALQYSQPKTLSIAVDDWVGCGPPVSAGLREFHERVGCNVRIIQVGEGQPIQALLSDQVDAVIASRYAVSGLSEVLHIEPIGELRLHYIISTAHKLAGAKPWEKPVNVPILTTRVCENTAYDAQAREAALCQRLGFTPQEIRLLESPADVVNMYLCNGAVIQPQILPSPEIVQYPSDRWASVILAWRKNTRHDQLGVLASLLKNHLQVESI